MDKRIYKENNNQRIESWISDSTTQVTHHLPDRLNDFKFMNINKREKIRKVTFGSFPGKSSFQSRGDAAARFNEIIAQLTFRNKTKLNGTSTSGGGEGSSSNSSGPVIYDNKVCFCHRKYQ